MFSDGLISNKVFEKVINCRHRPLIGCGEGHPLNGVYQRNMMNETGRIKALDSNVVNKIAAGEIIISPVNALKELLENAIDANSTLIDVLVKDGGIKLLQISDNGQGINKLDLPILCQRFTTSKLTQFEDLEQIETYGFRGEALASISHIARLTVTTKTKEDKCAWKVTFAQGEMCAEPSPVAGKDGTTILVEDLFYNVPSRLRALKSPNDEYNKILDVLGKYSIQCKGVGFTCKKFGNSSLSLTIKPNFSTQERIRSIYGNNIMSNLIPFQMDKDHNPSNTDNNKNDDLNIQTIEGQITNLNYLSKKSTPPIFFINHRLVTCEPLRRSLQQVYQIYLPKGNKPFIYLSILIDPNTVDVNVHPTKREVRFLNQDEIIEKISTDLQQTLMKLDTSRTFKASSLLTGSQQPIGNTLTATRTSSRSSNITSHRIGTSLSQRGSATQGSPFNVNKIKKYDHNLIRTDSTQSKITTFLRSSQYVNMEKRDDPINSSLISSEEENDNEPSQPTTNKLSFNESGASNTRVLDSRSNNLTTDKTIKTKGVESENEDDSDIEVTRIEANTSRLNSSFVSSQKKIEGKFNYVISPKQRVSINLTSIKQLREAVDDSTHRELTTVFANLIYVGVVDEERRLAAIQHDLKLFLVDYGSISYELFYQIGLTDFSNFGVIKLESSDDELLLVNILDVLDIRQDIKESVILKLWEMREMMEEYFSIGINCDGEFHYEKVKINSIPLLLKGYTPPLGKMPYFIYRLGTKVDWTDEKQCFDDILHQIALFYIPEIIPKKLPTTADGEAVNEEEKIAMINKEKELSSTLEHVLFPCIKRRLLAPRKLLKDVVEIANLPGLYKVFERC